MSYNLVDPTTGDLTRVAGNSNIVDTSIGIDSTWSSKKISADLADKQDFRIFNSLEEFNKKKGTSLTVVSGIDNMKDIVNAMSNGEILIIITKYELGSEVYFGLTKDTGWTKMFTFVKSDGLCDVECRTTFPLTLKRVLNSDGVIGDWQQLVTNDDIFRVGDRRNTIGWADLSNDVDIDGSSNYANDIGRIEGRNAIIKVSNPTIDYQWPVTNSGDSNNFMDFGGTIQLFVDKVNNHLYVRFANSVDMSAWQELATMDKVGTTQIIGFKTNLLNQCYGYYTIGNNKVSVHMKFVLSRALNDWETLTNVNLPVPSSAVTKNANGKTGASNSVYISTEGSMQQAGGGGMPAGTYEFDFEYTTA